jgi:hypothetical protein
MWIALLVKDPLTGLSMIGLSATSLGLVRDFWVLECLSVSSQFLIPSLFLLSHQYFRPKQKVPAFPCCCQAFQTVTPREMPMSLSVNDPWTGLGVIGLTTTSSGLVRDLWVLKCPSVKSIGSFLMAAEAREKWVQHWCYAAEDGSKQSQNSKVGVPR